MFVLTLLSRLFDPAVVITVLTVVAAARSFTDQFALVGFLLIYGLFMVAPPVYLLNVLIKKKVVTNWDVSNRKQRVKVLSGLLTFLFLDCILVWIFGTPLLARLYIVFFLWFVGFYAITSVWKISGHTGVLTLALGFMYMWFGPITLGLFLCIPLIAWVRVRRNNHTVGQVIGGVVYSMVTLCILSILKIY